MLVRWITSALVIGAVAYILPGVSINGVFAAFVTALVIGILNTFILPIIVLLTLPVTVLTLGAFLFVINALLVLLASAIVPGFHVDGFGWALLFSVIVSLTSVFLSSREP